MTTTRQPASERAPESGPPVSPVVVAAVLYVDEAGLEAVLDSVDRQVYEVESMVVIGGGPEGEGAAGARGIPHAAVLSEFVSGLPGRVESVWLLHGDASPRPDALGALVAEMERNDASLVGSKVVDSRDADQLESVGSATDVFGEPYSGLDPGEVDLEQYDVVRDVAFVSGVSVLVRRDLLRGLGGIDTRLPPVAAGMDLSQRARIAGGRVMVAPSSEVLHARRCGHDVAGWRELAGRMRAMGKAYRPITLLWVVPVGAIVGLIDGLVRLFLAASVAPLRDFVAAMGWNVVYLPSTLSARRALSRVRMAGDEELFRYQVGGSVRLRSLGTDLGERLGWTIDEEPAVITEEEMEADSRRAGPAVAALVLVIVGVAARRLWFGAFPSVRFTLPPAGDALSVLWSYAGGWNPAGLGSSTVLHPAPAAVALVQLAVGAAARPLLTAGSMILGVYSLGRLFRRLGIDGASRHLAAIVLFGGPFIARATGAGHWSVLIAAGAVPWMLDLAVTQWPARWLGRIGRIGLITLSAALIAPFAPVATLVPLVALVAGLLWMKRVRVAAVGRVAIGAAAGAVIVGPFLEGFGNGLPLSAGFGFDPWPELLPAGLAALAALTVAAGGPSPRWRVAAWGGSLVALAAVLAAIPGSWGEAGVAISLLGGLGSAVTVGAALPVDTSRRRTLVAVEAMGSLAAIGVLVLSLGMVPGGQGGLPDDVWGDRLEFVSSLAPPTGPDRVLLVGNPGSLPGDSRIADGYAYRLVWGDQPTFDQAWLADPLLGDRALDETLERIEAGDVVRPGQLLGDFAIRWVVVVDDAPFTDLLRSQVDLVERPLEAGAVVFENLGARPRAEAEGVREWTATRAGASGPAGDGTVRLADNVDPRWGPGWEQQDWANLLDAGLGHLEYRVNGSRWLLAWISAGLLAAALVAAVWSWVARR